jgi:hypothetical protein
MEYSIKYGLIEESHIEAFESRGIDAGHELPIIDLPLPVPAIQGDSGEYYRANLVAVVLYAYPVFQFFSVSGPTKRARFKSEVGHAADSVGVIPCSWGTEG